MLFNKKESETKKTSGLFGKKPEPKSSFSTGFKKSVMKGFREDSKNMSKQDRVNREIACQNVFGMSSEQFMKTMLK